MKHTTRLLFGIILLALFSQSCQILPAGSYTQAIVPINKPIYDSVVKISVPISGGFGLYSNPHSLNPTRDQKQAFTIRSLSAEVGIAVATKHASFGASTFYYNGFYRKRVEINDNLPGNNRNFSGLGFRLNGSFDKQLKDSATWRIVNVQASFYKESGPFGASRNYYLSELSSFTHSNAVANGAKTMDILLYSELAHKAKVGAFATSFGFMWYFQNTGNGYAIVNYHEGGVAPLTTTVVGAFMSVNYSYKNFFVRGGVTFSAFLVPLALINQALPPVLIHAQMGYSIPLR